MPQITAKLRHLHISPRKVRLVVDLIRGLPVKSAEAELLLLPKRASVHILKLLRSGIANAVHNFHLDPAQLYIKEIRVDKGFVMKRWWPRARGAVGKIEKKASHVSLILDTSDKIIQPGFVFVKKEKTSTTKKQKNPKTKKPAPKEKEEIKGDNKSIKGPEEKKKFFRRKSV